MRDKKTYAFAQQSNAIFSFFFFLDINFEIKFFIKNENYIGFFLKKFIHLKLFSRIHISMKYKRIQNYCTYLTATAVSGRMHCTAILSNFHHCVFCHNEMLIAKVDIPVHSIPALPVRYQIVGVG